MLLILGIGRWRIREVAHVGVRYDARLAQSSASVVVDCHIAEATDFFHAFASFTHQSLGGLRHTIKTLHVLAAAWLRQNQVRPEDQRIGCTARLRLRTISVLAISVIGRCGMSVWALSLASGNGQRFEGVSLRSTISGVHFAFLALCQFLCVR